MNGSRPAPSSPAVESTSGSAEPRQRPGTSTAAAITERDRSRAPDHGAEASTSRTRPQPPLAHPTHAVREHDRERGGGQRWRRRDGPRPRAPCPRTPRGRSAAGWPGAGSGADRERVRRDAAVHTAVTAEHQGGSAGVGATRTRACCPTNSSERPTARSVRIEGRRTRPSAAGRSG